MRKMRETYPVYGRSDEVLRTNTVNMQKYKQCDNDVVRQDIRFVPFSAPKSPQSARK